MATPCRDDTTVYPLKPNIPPCLVPTTLQNSLPLYMDYVIPFPRVRDNLIRHEGRFDPWELMQDLVGPNSGSTPAPQQRGTPVPATMLETGRPLTLSSASDTDEAHRPA